VNISQINTPKAHTSLALLYSPSMIISGELLKRWCKRCFTRYRLKLNLVPRALVWGRGERRGSPGLDRSRDYPKHGSIWQLLYSSRSGEIFFNEICKSSKQINSAKRLLNRYYLCVAKFGTNQLKYLKISSKFSKIYRYFWRFSTTGKTASKLHLGVSMQVVIHTKFAAFSRLEQYGYCL
jgi:hypothetical protein